MCVAKWLSYRSNAVLGQSFCSGSGYGELHSAAVPLTGVPKTLKSIWFDILKAIENQSGRVPVFASVDHPDWGRAFWVFKPI